MSGFAAGGLIEEVVPSPTLPLVRSLFVPVQSGWKKEEEEGKGGWMRNGGDVSREGEINQYSATNKRWHHAGRKRQVLSGIDVSFSLLVLGSCCLRLTHWNHSYWAV